MPKSGPNKEFLITETSIPDIFIARYMPLLGKDAISLYLWTAMTAKGGSFSLDDALSYGGIPEADVKTALAELVAAGVLVRSEDNRFDPVDLRLAEVDEYIASRTDDDGVPVMRSDEAKRNLLATSVNKTYYQGYMAYTFYRLIDKCLYEYKYEDDVVYALFEEGKELRIQYVAAKMYDLAKKWYERGYITSEALKEYYDVRDRRNAIIKLTGKLLRKHLNDFDYQRINTWAEFYGANEEIVEYAVKANDWRSTIRTEDVGNKIKEWFDAGITTVDKAMIYEEERKKENKAKSASSGRRKSGSRRSGAEAGITAPSKEKKAEEQTPAPIAHDSILDMFSEDE